MAEIDHINVKLLYSGVNTRGEFRNVLYMPWTDGFAVLYISDENDQLVTTFEIKDISCLYMPEEYWHDLPFQFKPPQIDYKNR